MESPSISTGYEGMRYMQTTLHPQPYLCNTYITTLLRAQFQLDEVVPMTGTLRTHTRLGKSAGIAYARDKMYDDSSDEQLMLQYKEGDTKAFETLYSRFRLPMFRYLKNQCGNEAIAEEIFQDVWMNLIRSSQRYQVTASFKTYIYRLAHNRLIDHYRKQKHGIPSSYNENEGLLNTENTSDQLNPQRHASADQQIAQLYEAITQLPEAQREAFLLKEETGLSVEEIAEMTNVKPETTKSRIRYAMKKLRQAVEVD